MLLLSVQLVQSSLSSLNGFINRQSARVKVSRNCLRFCLGRLPAVVWLRLHARQYSRLPPMVVDGYPAQWRRQLWGTGARAPLDFQI